MKRSLLLWGFALLLLIGCAGTRHVSDPGEAARGFGQKAYRQFNEGNLVGARRSYERAFSEAAKADVPQLQAKYLFNIGRIYYEFCQYDSALYWFLLARKEFEAQRDPQSSSTAAAFIALSFSKAGIRDSSRIWFRNAQDGALISESFMLMAEAQLLIDEKKFTAARSLLDRAAAVLQKDRHGVHSLALTNYLLGEISIATGDHGSAKNYLMESMRLLDRVPERYRRWRVLVALCASSFCANDSNAAQRYYQRALDCMPRGMNAPPIETLAPCIQTRQGCCRRTFSRNGTRESSRFLFLCLLE